MNGVNNQLSLEQFNQGINLLASVYGDNHAVFTNEVVTSIWYRYFSNYTKERWSRVIEHYIAHSQWFPKAPHEIAKLWDESGEEQRLTQQQLAALPPVQNEEFTPEQLIENQRKINLAMKLMVLAKGVKVPPLNQISSHELEAMVEGAKKAHSAQKATVVLERSGQLKVQKSENSDLDDLFQMIRAYFHSGSERYRQMAINWASDPNSGCKFVRNRKGEIVDIKQVEF